MTDVTCFEFDGYRLNVASRELWHNGERVDLPYRVFDCLAYLVEHRDRAVGRDELVAAIWGRVDISDAQLGQIVLRVRRAVGDDGNVQRAIRTMPKFGYHWVAPTRAVAAPVPTPGETPVVIDATRAPVETAISATARPGTPARHRRPLPWLIPVLTIGLLLVAAALLWPIANRQPVESATTTGIVVLPIEIDADDDHDWARLGAMDLIASRLRAAGLAVPSTENMLALLQSNAATSVIAASGPDVEALRRALAAEMVIGGRLHAVDAGGWRLALDVARHGTPQRHVQAESEDLIAAARRGSDRLLIELGHAPPATTENDLRLEEVLQRAQAAMLANQLEVARSILTGAPELLRAQPQLRYLLSQVDIRAGRLLEVRTVLEELLVDPAVTADTRLYGAMLNTLGFVHFNMDQAEIAEGYFDRAIEVLGEAGDPLELGRSHAGRGGARGAQLRYDEALTDFGHARVRLGQIGDRLNLARVDQVLGSFELRRPRLRQARSLLERANAELETLGAINEYLYGLALLVRLELAELNYERAGQINDRALTLHERAADPESRHIMTIHRAEISLLRGQHRNAAAALTALADEAPPSNPWALGMGDWMRAWLAWATDDKETALAFADAAYARIGRPEYGRAATRIVLLRQRALLASDRIGEARERLAEFETGAEPEAGALVALLVSRAELAAAIAAGDALVDESFRDALAASETTAIPEDMALAGDAYANHLMDQGRLDEASAVVGRLSPWAEADYRCALLQVRLYHQLGQVDAWSRALAQAQRLAGERVIPEPLRQRPVADPGSTDSS